MEIVRKQYTIGKKLCAILGHQLMLILTMDLLCYTERLAREHLLLEDSLLNLVPIFTVVASFVMLAYLTVAAGNHADGEEPHDFLMDKIPSDLFLFLFAVVVILCGKWVMAIDLDDFKTTSLLVAVGTITYVMDFVFLLLYLSIIRRIKKEKFISSSILYKALASFERLSKEMSMSSRYIPAKAFGIALLFLFFMLFNQFAWRWCLVGAILTSITWLYLGAKRTFEMAKIKKALVEIADGNVDIHLNSSEFSGQQKEIAEAVNNIRDGLNEAVQHGMKNERMRTDLITNVSHDIKTPLTSIVNYVGLLKLENLENENAKYYIKILDEKSQRLKNLTEDLVEASRISSGNIKLEMMEIDWVELIYQTGGEFNERFETRGLTIVTKLPNQAVIIKADGRQLYRTMENLYTNAAKYAMENTRVYVELACVGKQAVFTIKNVSQAQLSEKSGGELMERFVRGETSRTTEGSGLGLSIARNLATLMGAEFGIEIDGDLFIATIKFEILDS